MLLTSNATERNPIIDIIRALCIIFVVLGHCGFPFTKELYSFHVPLFFMVSGMTEKDFCVADSIKFRDYFFRKIKRLYIPVVIFSIIEVVFHNFLIKAHIYITKEQGEGLLYAFQYVNLYSYNEIIERIFKAFAFAGGSQLGGALWFFRVLFFISIIFKIECILLKNRKHRLRYLTFLNSFFFVIGWTFSTRFGHFPYGIETICFMMLFYHIGFCIKNYYYIYIKSICNYKLVIINLSFLTIVLLSSFFKVDIGQNVCTNPIFLIITTFSSFLFCFTLSDLVIKTKLKNPMLYIGQNTVCIVLFHFFAFKLLNLFIVFLYGYDYRYGASFPVLNKKLWFLYAFFGIFFPLMLNKLYKHFKVLTKRN